MEKVQIDIWIDGREDEDSEGMEFWGTTWLYAHPIEKHTVWYPQGDGKVPNSDAILDTSRKAWRITEESGKNQILILSKPQLQPRKVNAIF